MTGGLISLRYLSADDTCITMDRASRSEIVLCYGRKTIITHWLSSRAVTSYLFEIEVEVMSITVFEHGAEGVGVDLKHIKEIHDPAKRRSHLVKTLLSTKAKIFEVIP